jgi:hypothetical protein
MYAQGEAAFLFCGRQHHKWSTADDRHWLPARSGTVHGGGTMMFRPTGTITVE